MAGPGSRLRKFFTGKPFALWVVSGSLVYTALALLGLLVPFIAANPAIATDPFVLIFFVFVTLFILSGFLAMTGKRWSLVLAAVLSLVFIVLLGPLIADTFANPANVAFPLAISGIPALVLAAVFSILSLLSFKKGISTRPYLASPHSPGGLFAFAVVGFVIGGLAVGAAASILIGQLLQTAGEPADIRIVNNAAAGPAGGVAEPYDPQVWTIRRDDTVTWINSDTSTHTVTSNATGLFDSGNLGSGGRFSFTFPNTGTFEYHCAPHAGSMWGTIVVTP